MPAFPCGQEAGETDTNEALRQRVKEEPPEELVGGKRQGTRGVIAFPVLPSEGDLAIVETDEPVVRDRDAMGVTGEVVEDMFRSAEGSLRVDHPVDMVQRSDEGAEVFRVIEAFQIAEEPQLSPPEGSPQHREQLPAKDPAEHAHRQEEPVTRRNPAGVIRRQTPRRNDTVDMRMVSECLRPGVEHAENTDLSPEMFRIAGHLPECLGAGLKQQVIDHPFVLIRQTRDRLGDGKDDMDVTGRQQLPGPPGDPPVPGSGLALRTVPVSARVVGEGTMRTRRLGTPVPVTTEIGRAAPQDRIEDAGMPPVGRKVGTMTTDDIGQLQGWPGHLFVVPPSASRI